MTEPITATIKGFMALSGLTRTEVWRLRRDGKLRSVKIGKRVMIILDSYRELCGLTHHLTHTHNETEPNKPAQMKRRRVLSNRGDWRSTS
jgi:hypothetical protein